MRAWYASLEEDDPRRAHEHYRWSDDRGLYFADNFAGPDDGRKSRPRYEIIHPLTRRPCKKPSTGWRWDEARTKRALAAKPPLIHFGPDETTIPNRKSYLAQINTQPFTSVFYRDGRAGTIELEQIIGPGQINFPKNTDVLKELINLATDEDSVVLDSFAGSGTTAQAVLALNAEDGGSRRFVLVEQEDYAETLTAERVRRVIAGVPGATDPALQAGLGGSFSFFRLGEAIDEQTLLSGEHLPAYRDLARYVFFTTTGEQIDERQIDEEHYYLGPSRRYEVYMLYRPDVQFLKSTPLTLHFAEQLGPPNGKPHLVIAPYKVVDDGTLRERNIEYCQLPFGIYRFRV